jgi:hypothetical protein
LSDAVAISIVSAVGSFAAAAMSLLNNLLVRRTAEDMRTLERNTNSIKDELVRVTRSDSYKDGVKAGQKDASL